MKRRHSWLPAAAAGGAAGLINGFFGGGGGMVLVPLLMSQCGLDRRRAFASSVAIILPLCAIVSGGSLPVSHQTAMLDLPVCLITVLIAIVPALISQKFRRSQGLIILGVYVAYLIFLTSGLF